MPKEPQQNIKGIDENQDNLREEKRNVDKSYYYDDAHGYEEYDPKGEKEDENAEEFED